MRLSHLHEIKVQHGDDTYEVSGTVIRHAENLWDEFKRGHKGKIDRPLFLAKTEAIAKTAAFESGYPWWVVLKAIRSVLAQRDRKRRPVRIQGAGYDPRPRPEPRPTRYGRCPNCQHALTSRGNCPNRGGRCGFKDDRQGTLDFGA